MKCKIVADSSANMYQLDGVDFVSVPLKIVTAEREFTDVETTDIEEMVTYLQGYKGRSGTSCPNVQDWLSAFGDADVILGVTITSNLSGSYEAAMQARADYLAAHPDAKVFILDTLSAGPEMALIVEKMKKVIDAGLPFDKMCDEIRAYSKRTHLLFALEHLDNLARNGRVNPAVAKIAGVLGLRFIGKASDHGTLQQVYKTRGDAQTVSRIWKAMKELHYRGGKVRITHCLNPKSAQALADMIREACPDAQVDIAPCGALCSFYAEKGGLMIGFEG